MVGRVQHRLVTLNEIEAMVLELHRIEVVPSKMPRQSRWSKGKKADDGAADANNRQSQTQSVSAAAPSGKKPNQNQKDQPRRVAIIGGGLSGLALAYSLTNDDDTHGLGDIQVDVFDTGRHAVGGRCSSTRISTGAAEADETHVVDHGAQLLSTSNAAGAAETHTGKLLAALQKGGALQECPKNWIQTVDWSGGDSGGAAGASSTKYFIGSDADGFGSLPKWLAKQVTASPQQRQGGSGGGQRSRSRSPHRILIDVWVSEMKHAKSTGPDGSVQWLLTTNKPSTKGTGRGGKPPAQGPYDYVVVSHSGKCATRLVETAPHKTLAHDPLKCRFIVSGMSAGKGAKRNSQGGSSKPWELSTSKLDIGGVYVVVVGFDPATLSKSKAAAGKGGADAAQFGAPNKPIYNVSSHPVLAMACNNTAKYRKNVCFSTSKSVWTLLSTTDYAARNKHPQEFLPERVKDQVAEDLVQAFCEVVLGSGVAPVGGAGGADGAPAPAAPASDKPNRAADFAACFRPVHQVRLWGAGLPANILGSGAGNQANQSLPAEYIHDSANGVGVVGDWLVAPNIEGALWSGLALGERLLREWNRRSGEASGSAAQKPPKFRFAPAAVAPAPGAGSEAGSGSGSGEKNIEIPVCGDTPVGVLEKLHARAQEGSKSAGKDEKFAPPARARNASAKPKADQTTADGAEPPAQKPDVAWKWALRHEIWDKLESEDIARAPRPVHHRIPNFEGADVAASSQFAALKEWRRLLERKSQGASGGGGDLPIVKVNPDSPQKPVRQLVLGGGLELWAPQPRLVSGFFSSLRVDDGSVHGNGSANGAVGNGTSAVEVLASSAGESASGNQRTGKSRGLVPNVPRTIGYACTAAGMKEYGWPMKLGEMRKPRKDKETAGKKGPPAAQNDSVVASRPLPDMGLRVDVVRRAAGSGDDTAAHGPFDLQLRPLTAQNSTPKKVQMIVIGSVAVDPSTGARVGKGEGFAELEYGLLRMMGNIEEKTLIVSTVHDCQVRDFAVFYGKFCGTEPQHPNLLAHDVPVDVICTPTKTIYVDRNKQKPKPTGIYWDLLSPQKLNQVGVLRSLKRRVEEELRSVSVDGLAGELPLTLPSGPDEQLPPTAVRVGGKGGGGKGGGAKGGGKRGSKGGGRR